MGRQLLHFWAGLAHSHGAPAGRAPSYGTGLPLPAAADKGRLRPLARRPPARRAPSDGTGLPLALPLVGVAAASLLTRAGFAHWHTYMPGHGAPARAAAAFAFLAGSNALPPVLAMSSAGDGARVWRQANAPVSLLLGRHSLFSGVSARSGGTPNGPHRGGELSGRFGPPHRSAKICRLYNSPGGSRC